MIVVTGASGLLGANYALAVLQRDADLVAVYNQNVVDFPGARCIQADLSDKRTSDELMYSLHPKWVVHCAGLTNVDYCQERPDEAYRVNVKMSRNVAVSAYHAGSSFVYVSTDSIFDGKTGRYSESDVPRPVNAYAESKLAAEAAVVETNRNSLIIRTNIYGWNMQQKQSLAEWMLSRLELGQTLLGFHDVIFTPILVNDLSEVILDMMQRQLSGLYHIGSSRACSKYEFALELANVFDLDKHLIRRISVESSSLKAPRPRNTSLQSAKVVQELGRSMPDVRSGLQRFKALRDSGFVTKLKALRGQNPWQD